MGLKTEQEISESTGQARAPFLETKTVDVGGVHTRYADQGEGDVVLLLHGFPETLQGWRETVPMLSTAFRVLAPDMIGAGETDKPAIQYTPQEMAEFVRQFLETLGIERVHVVGTDTGMSVAVAFLAAYPEKALRAVR